MLGFILGVFEGVQLVGLLVGAVVADSIFFNINNK